jgi:hypothetical protein
MNEMLRNSEVSEGGFEPARDAGVELIELGEVSKKTKGTSLIFFAEQAPPPMNYAWWVYP